jgi:hypothetical protein
MATLRDNWIVIAIGVAVIAGLVLLIWLWWWIPKWQMRGAFSGAKRNAPMPRTTSARPSARRFAL